MTLGSGDPAARLWSLNDTSFPNTNATLTSRSPVPAVASASSSFSSSPFAPPSRSSPSERESNMTAISVTGPTDDPTPVSRESDGQTNLTRRSMENDAEDDDDEEQEQDESKIPTSLDHALPVAFTHNSTNPNVAASTSAPAATRSSRNHNHLPDHGLDISPAVPPSSIAHRLRSPSSRPFQTVVANHAPHINSLTDLLLTALPELARTEIAIPPRALSHLHPSHDRLNPVRNMQEMQQHAIRQCFYYEGAVVGARGLLPSLPSAEFSPVSRTATLNESLDLDLDLDISMDLEAGPAGEDAHGVINDVVPPYPPVPLLRSSGAHNHPYGPMFCFVILELDGVDHSLGAGVDRRGSIDWRAGNVFGCAGDSTDTGIGEYAGNGTIDPSVLGGGANNSPGKLVDGVSSPIRGFSGAQPERATDEDDEEEDDVTGMLFENTGDDDFVPLSGLGKGKGRAGVVDDFVESPESMAAAAGSRMRRKRYMQTK
ncbi:hypothetical protein H4582DRAFT_2077583 [Lactarius indigo]|nr:hypothetical protein H4582DRAFT_2077583 [Lactarius indigo]